MFIKYMTNKKERDKTVTEKEFWEVKDGVIDLNTINIQITKYVQEKECAKVSTTMQVVT